MTDRPSKQINKKKNKKKKNKKEKNKRKGNEQINTTEVKATINAFWAYRDQPRTINFEIIYLSLGSKLVAMQIQ